MIKLGTALRRKSIEKAQPSLPRSNKPRQFSGTGRTIYHQLKSPSQELKQFRKKQLYTMGNLNTEHSLSNIRADQFFPKRHSRFNDDDLNTESIAQLLQSKVYGSLTSGRKHQNETSKGIQQKTPKQDSRRKSRQSQNLQSKNQKEAQQKQQQDDQQQIKDAQNYDDYVLGDQIPVQQQTQQKSQAKTKKYQHDNKKDILDSYQPNSQSQRRMEVQHWAREKKKMNEIREDQQIIAIMNKYQNNKLQILNQSKKRHQTATILASVSQNYQKKMQKTVSLPSLKPKYQIILEENIEQVNQQKPVQPWKNTKNLLGRETRNISTDRIRINQFRLKQSMSYGKLGFGKKKIRTICEQDVMQDQMKQLQQIKNKLRSKGIPFDANKLKKGLINEKNPSTNETNLYPEKILPSNFIYKKFPL